MCSRTRSHDTLHIALVEVVRLSHTMVSVPQSRCLYEQVPLAVFPIVSEESRHLLKNAAKENLTTRKMLRKIAIKVVEKTRLGLFARSKSSTRIVYVAIVVRKSWRQHDVYNTGVRSSVPLAKTAKPTTHGISSCGQR